MNNDNYMQQKNNDYENKNILTLNKEEQLLENTTINEKSALDYVKYLLNDSEENNKINYSELREELETSTFEEDTFNKKKYDRNKKIISDYTYFKEENDKLNEKDIDINSLDEFPTEYEEYITKINIFKNNITQLKKELLEEKNNNKILQEENMKLKQSLQEANKGKEKKNAILEDSDYIDTQLKLNPEQQITLEKLQELMIQLSKKIEKLKNDNETLKQKVILSNKEKENKIINSINTDNNSNERFINILTDEECRYVLSYICTHLKIKDFSNIETNLKNVELTIKAVPQMQKFISEIDELVWKSKDEEKIHKLSETLNEIKKLIKKAEY